MTCLFFVPVLCHVVFNLRDGLNIVVWMRRLNGIEYWVAGVCVCVRVYAYAYVRPDEQV